MVTESRGALLSPGSEWERLVETVERAALDRTAKWKGPSGVHAAASGTVLPNVVAASLFLTRANEFFDSKGTLGFHGNWEQLDCADMPPGAKPPLEPVEPQGSGFGILYIRLINPEWRDDD
ncbi:hypothetical protein WM26_18595 [Burkholderia cepacia]|nr:hypothetical protein WM26_18595 [Burkholderia cepacia]